MSVLPFLVIQLVIFVALVMILRLIISRNLTDASGRLQRLSAEYAQRQEELKTRLDEVEQQYTERIARAQVDADRIAAQARQEAELGKTKTLEEARAESERIVQQGMESREALRKDLDQHISQRALERACELVQHVFPGEIRRELQAQWMDDLISNGFSQLDALPAEEHVEEAAVVSAFPLTGEQQRALQARLKEKLGRTVKVTYGTDERLVAGLTITLGNLVVDGSLATRLQRAARNAQRADT